MDLMWIEENPRMVDGTHPAAYLFESARRHGLQAVPATGLVRAQECQQAYRDVIKQDGRGVCIRIQREDFANSDDLDGRIAALLNYFGTPEREADLILDLRAIGENVQVDEIASMVEQVPRLTQWRSFALCGTAFPPDLMGLAPSARSLIPRTEWSLWTELIRSRSLAREPSFGDYVIASPQPSEVDPRIMRPSASIRYATNENWLILKGQNLRDHGFGQFHEVARTLTQAPEYSGPAFSWGDRYINDCANRLVGTGNLTTWRKVGTSHHLALAVKQLASFRAT
jgi:Beta protein